MWRQHEPTNAAIGFGYELHERLLHCKIPTQKTTRFTTPQRSFRKLPRVVFSKGSFLSAPAVTSALGVRYSIKNAQKTKEMQKRRRTPCVLHGVRVAGRPHARGKDATERATQIQVTARHMCERGRKRAVAVRA